MPSSSSCTQIRKPFVKSRSIWQGGFTLGINEEIITANDSQEIPMKNLSIKDGCTQTVAFANGDIKFPHLS